MYKKLASQLLSLRIIDEAEAKLNTALALAPRDPMLMLQMARVHLMHGRHAEALSHIQTAVDIDGGSSAVITVASGLLIEAADYGRALALLDRLRDDTLDPHRERLRASARTKLAEDTAAGLSPEGKALYHQAMEHLRRGQPDLAEPMLARLVQLCPAFAPGWIGLRGALEALGRTEQVRALQDAWSAGAEGDSPVVHIGMARTLGSRGLVFDPRDRFPVRPMGELFRQVASAAELKASDNAYLVLDRGGQVIEHDPIVSLDHGGEDKIPLRYTSAPRFVASVKNAALVGRAVVVNETGDIASEFMLPWKIRRYGVGLDEQGLDFGAAAYSDGMVPVTCFDTPALLLAGTGDTAFGDWMMTYATRLAMAEAAELDIPVVLRSEPLAQALDMLEALGVRRDRILWHDPRGVSLFPELYVTATPRPDKLSPVRGMYDLFRRAALPAPSRARGQLLYLSRLGNRNRLMVNEAEVCDLFARRGFKIVNPGELSFDETRRIFANPACVAGGFGSAFHNLAFCSSKPVNLVLFSPAAPSKLAEMTLWQGELGMRFGYLWGDIAPDAPSNGRPQRAAWIAPLDKLDHAIDQILKLATSEALGPGPH